MPKIPRSIEINAVVYKTERLNEKNIQIDFNLIKPAEINFLPGQFISIYVGDSKYRSYSISSSSDNKESFSIIASVGHEGVGAKFLKKLKPGDKVSMIGPSGRFVLPDNLRNNLVFIATGTGIAPFISMFEFLAHTSPDRNITVLYGVRNENELMLIQKLETLSRNFADFHCKVCFSKNVPVNKAGISVIEYVSGRVTKNLINVDKDAQYFLCGNPNMVTETKSLLTKAGVPLENIFTENFTVS